MFDNETMNKIYDNAKEDFNNKLISEDIINGILDNVYNGTAKIEFDNKINLEDVVNNIEKILMGD